MNESEGTSTSGVRPSAVPIESLSANGSHPREGHFVIAKCQRDTDSTTKNCNQETSEESDCEERLLTVFCRSGRLGAACYTLQTGELQILEEIVDRPPEYQIFLALFRQIDPVKILLDGKAQSTFTAVVKSTVFSTDTNEHGKCKLIFMSSKEYNFEACKRRILTLSLPGEPVQCSDDDRVMFLRTAVDFSQTQSVHALGALLRYLDLNWTNLCMDLHGKPEFLSLKRISLADIVTMDEDTYRGLQIFSPLAHPSDFKKGMQGSNKEGLSLFKLFSKCSSTVGQKRLRVLMRHPTTDMAVLKRRQDVVAFFMRPQSDSIMRNICSSLRFVKNVNGILAKIKALSSKAYQWKSLYNTLYNAVLICELCEGAGAASELLQQLAASDNNNLYEMALYMNRIIDFDLSKSEGKFTVKPGVDPDLDMKKQTMASLHGLMSETARVELERLPARVRECSMLYMPHLGYLLAVRAWDHHLTADQKELPDMKFMFQNNEYIHYKSKGCEELDVLIGDTYPEIVAHETRIMMRLADVVLRNLTSLAAVVDRCAELDCLIAISKVSKELNFVRPQLTAERTISITQGRHPLLQLTSDCVVPNDCTSTAPALTVLCGPNSSGKSVYIKQIGLIVYLAHIGSFVPAERATLGVLARLHSRLHATETIAGHMSAFLIDLRQMSLALQESAAHSLVLVDEFGKGTAAADGLALLAASLNTLLLRGPRAPHLLLATHYRNLHHYLVDSPTVRFLTFEHMVADGEPVFLFRVAKAEGPAGGASFAREVAGAAGVAPAVLHRADAVLHAITNNDLPPENKKIIAKLRNITDEMKRNLTREEI